MFNPNRESPHERKIAFHGEAPFAKHDYRYRTKSSIRMAGKVWSEGPSERSARLDRMRKKMKMQSNPVGLGFGERDSFGPDNDYGSVNYIKQTPDQGYYRVSKNR